MSYGYLSSDQRKTLKPFVARRVVYDLGAGSLELSIKLLDLQAASVIAVDTERPPKLANWSTRLRYVQADFSSLKKRPRTAFVSWPWATSTGIELALKNASTIIYLGSNLDGSACGSPELWEHLRTRRVLAHEPHAKNTLIVYGKVNGERSLLPEEEAAIDFRNVRKFTDVYGKEKP